MNRPRNVTTWASAGRRADGRGNTTANWANVTGTSAAVAQSTRTTARTTTGSARLRRIPTSMPHTASVVAKAANQRLTDRRGFRTQTTTANAASIKATKNRPTNGGMELADRTNRDAADGSRPLVVFRTPQDDRRVRGADRARGHQDAVHSGGAPATGHVVEIALGGRNVVIHGRGDELLRQREACGDHLERAPCRERLADHGLDRGHRHVVRVAPE